MDNIKTLDLNLLKALNALLEECNVTKAANKLSLTQPAVSSMLNRLRDKFNDPLFVRSSHGIVPTDRALSLAAPVKQILSDINKLIQPVVFDPAFLDVTFKIAANDNDMQVIGLPFILALKKIAPRVNLSFISYHHVDVQSMLARGELDLILTDPKNSPPLLRSRIIYHERYVCLLRKDHPMAHKQKLTLDEFCSLEHVLVSNDGGQFYGVSDEALAKIGRKRRVSLSVTSFLMLPSILQKSDFITVAPERLAKSFTNLALLPPPLEISGYTKIMAWHERNHHDQIQKWLRQLMLQSFS
ncbi:LysR family transcriptional regulator [Bartonella sp. HY406]|uniref:LysR family transcriptional regulator n=1 Tax=Bartonella sp. HY406 TaxID=2979331 RepID=UPI0021CA62E0|nr:LysR family transcriptional regulator [Bartonella sp. HY406]UXN02867.1 LysR family transcriptional regulator [Bartonella sp. HY406]